MQSDRRLHEGITREISFRLQGIDDLLEWQVLMIQCIEHGFPDVAEEFQERRIAARIDANDHGVDETADRVGPFLPVAPGDRRAERQRALLAEARQEHTISGGQNREQTAALLRREVLQQTRWQHTYSKLQPAAAVAWQAWTRVVARQCQYRWHAGQLLAPVTQAGLLRVERVVLTLPASKLQILRRWNPRTGRFVLDVPCVRTCQFIGDQSYRPTIGDHVVRGDQQQVTVFVK